MLETTGIIYKGQEKNNLSDGEHVKETRFCCKGSVTISAGAFQHLQQLSHFSEVRHLCA